MLIYRICIRDLPKYCNIHAVSMELVRFDMQQMQKLEISGIQYQQGELARYEVQEYLLEKGNRTCVYCGKPDVPLEIEHIVPRLKGGSNWSAFQRWPAHQTSYSSYSRNICRHQKSVSDKRKPLQISKGALAY